MKYTTICCLYSVVAFFAATFNTIARAIGFAASAVSNIAIGLRVIQRIIFCLENVFTGYLNSLERLTDVNTPLHYEVKYLMPAIPKARNTSSSVDIYAIQTLSSDRTQVSTDEIPTSVGECSHMDGSQLIDTLNWLRQVVLPNENDSLESSCKPTATSLDVDPGLGGSEPFMLAGAPLGTIAPAQENNFSSKYEMFVFYLFHDWVMNLWISFQKLTSQRTSLDVPELSSSEALMLPTAPLGAAVASTQELPPTLMVAEKTSLDVPPDSELLESVVLPDSAPLGAIAPAKSPLGDQPAIKMGKTVQELKAMMIADLRNEIASEIARGGQLKMPPKKTNKPALVKILLNFYKSQK